MEVEGIAGIFNDHKLRTKCWKKRRNSLVVYFNSNRSIAVNICFVRLYGGGEAGVLNLWLILVFDPDCTN